MARASESVSRRAKLGAQCSASYVIIIYRVIYFSDDHWHNLPTEFGNPMPRMRERRSLKADHARYTRAEEAFTRAAILSSEIDNGNPSSGSEERAASLLRQLSPRLRGLRRRCENLHKVSARARNEESGIYGHLDAIRSAVRILLRSAEPGRDRDLGNGLRNSAAILAISGEQGRQCIVSARAAPKDWEPRCPNCGKSRRREDWDRLCCECRSCGELARILIDYRTNRSAIRSVAGIADFKRLLCLVFKHEIVSESTLNAFEVFMDSASTRRGETLAEGSQRWRASMRLSEAVSYLEAECERRQGVLEAFSLGDGCFEVGSEAIKLESAQASVLESLVTLRAATKSELVRQSGVADAPRVLKQIKRQVPVLSRFILIPGRRGKGGYRTTIRRRDQ